jgi:type I restriction enzyme S subunit
LHIAPDNIEKGTGKLLPCRTVGEDRVTSANHLFERGQIIYSKIRPRLRKVVVAPFDGLCSADMYPLKTQLDTQYVFYYILSESFNQQVNEATSNRVLLPKINKKELQKIYIPLPPLGEQNRIARIVTDVFAQLDLIDDLQMQYANDMDTLKTKLFEAALRGKLTKQLPEDGTAEELYQQIQAEKRELVKAKKIKKTQTYQMIDEKEIPFEIPNTWKWVRLGELCSSSGGKTPSMENNQYWQNGTVSWITSKDMKQKYLDTSEMLITEEAAKEMNLYSEGTVLMVVRSGILRRMLPVSILTGPSTINQDLKALIPNDLVLSEYLFLLLKGFESKILHKHAKEGTTVNSIRFEELLTMPVPLPPKPEQMRIVDRIDGITSLL